MVSRLTSLAMQQVTLEDILNIGLESLPSDDEFLRSLARMITEEIVPYYETNGWQLFRQDLIFVIASQGEPLDYRDVSLYWNKWKHGYLLISAEVNDTAASYFFYDTLGDVIGQIMLTLVENHETTQDVAIDSVVNIDAKQKEVYDFMATRYQQDVDILINHLEEGGLIHIDGSLGIFSMYPLNNTTSAYIVMDDDKLVIVGLFNDDLFDDIDPEFNNRSNPYTISFARDDVKRIIAILVYNPDKYQLVSLDM